MKRKNAQSILDYALLMAVIAISVAAMWGYVLKAINARFAHLKADYFNPWTHPR
jgi:Flp pilus assembly pilin Flp